MKPIEYAFRELVDGVAELPDPAEHPHIVEYHKTVGIGPDDETSWCSSFTAWCHEQAGVPIVGVTGAARSWLKWGMGVATPRLGDVVVFWRGSIDGWQGHVGFYAGEGGGTILVLGGNQGNRVSIAPYSKERLLGYRRAST